jgi:hypothetical protein
MPMPAGMAQDLGNLLENLNPYSGRAAAPGYPLPTGEMDIYAGNPAPTVPPSGTVPQIEFEVETRYPPTWDFKGQPQRIAKAIRIRYRIPVINPSTGAVLYYVDDYLLIGFEGSNS